MSKLSLNMLQLKYAVASKLYFQLSLPFVIWNILLKDAGVYARHLKILFFSQKSVQPLSSGDTEKDITCQNCIRSAQRNTTLQQVVLSILWNTPNFCHFKLNPLVSHTNHHNSNHCHTTSSTCSKEKVKFFAKILI